MTVVACALNFLLHWTSLSLFFFFFSERALYGLGNYASSCHYACCDVSVRDVDFSGGFLLLMLLFSFKGCGVYLFEFSPLVFFFSIIAERLVALIGGFTFLYGFASLNYISII